MLRRSILQVTLAATIAVVMNAHAFGACYWYFRMGNASGSGELGPYTSQTAAQNAAVAQTRIGFQVSSVYQRCDSQTGGGTGSGGTTTGGGGGGTTTTPQRDPCWYLVGGSGSFFVGYDLPRAVELGQQYVAQGYSFSYVEDRCGGRGRVGISQDQRPVPAIVFYWQVPAGSRVLASHGWQVYSGQTVPAKPYVCNSALAQKRYQELVNLLSRNGVNPQGNIQYQQTTVPASQCASY